MKLGYVGLGKMGKNMVLHLLEQGVEVVAWNRSPEPLGEVVKAGAVPASNLSDLISKLDTPRVIWLMLPAGEVTDEFIDQLIPLLNEGNLVIDGANSFYKDTLRRSEKLKERGIHFMDVGVSGGPGGARNGACLMVGGEMEDYERNKELLNKIALLDGVAYLGKIGSGHFTKMVHNGIEYGMMEAFGEGFAILENYGINVKEAARIYSTGSVIESKLSRWLEEALEEDSKLEDISSKINATGEGEWTVDTGKELGLDVRVIEDSFKVRQESSEDSEDFRAKVVSALRGKFGGHKVHKG